MEFVDEAPRAGRRGMRRTCRRPRRPAGPDEDRAVLPCRPDRICPDVHRLAPQLDLLLPAGVAEDGVFLRVLPVEVQQPFATIGRGRAPCSVPLVCGLLGGKGEPQGDGDGRGSWIVECCPVVAKDDDESRPEGWFTEQASDYKYRRPEPHVNEILRKIARRRAKRGPGHSGIPLEEEYNPATTFSLNGAPLVLVTGPPGSCDMNARPTDDGLTSSRRPKPRPSGSAGPWPRSSSRGRSSAWSARWGRARPGWSGRSPRRLGVDPGAIASPTFVLIHEYEGRLPVYHFDAYRLDVADDVRGPGRRRLLGRRAASAWSSGPTASPDRLPADGLVGPDRADRARRSASGVGRRSPERAPIARRG